MRPAAQPASQDQHHTVSALIALRPYLSLLRGQEIRLVAATILMTMSTAVSLAIPLAAGRFVDALTLETAQRLAESTPHSGLFMLAGLLVLQLAAAFSFSVVSAQLALNTVTALRRRFFAHLLELPALFFTGQRAGDLSSRVTSDVGAIQYVLTWGLVALARAVLTLAGALVLMTRLNGRLTLVVLVLIPATILLVRLFGSGLQRLSRRMFDELGRINSHVQETVGGIRTLKVFNAQRHEKNRFDTMIDGYRRAGLKRAWLRAGLEAGIQLALWICLIGVVVYGFVLMARGQATGGQLVAFLLLVFRVAMPVTSLTSLYSETQGAAAAAVRLDAILALEPERDPSAPMPTPCHGAAGIRLDGVSFRYPEASPDQAAVLQDFDLSIAPGQWVGIVGPSGAGKTTLAGLLMGLFPPTGGRLYLDEVPFDTLDVAELRSRMAFVAQEPVLYDLSLADNIRFGLTTATDDQVEAAAEQAGVMEFAPGLEIGLETVCGEHGARLSGGQRQRVALARAFLRDPGVLILDEPTSALDAASEDSVQRALRAVMNGRTAIVIAHRLSLVRDLDLIIVVSDGRVLETGTHSELMAKCGLYRHLYDLQQGPGPGQNSGKRE